jgi:hypothetical protein
MNRSCGVLVLSLWMLLPGCPTSDPIPNSDGELDAATDTPELQDGDGKDPPPIDLDCTASPSSGKPLPSAEPGVRIVEPTGLTGGLVSSGTVMIGGRAWGAIDRLLVQRADGQGPLLTVSPVPFYWQAGPFMLEAGDTEILVRAESDALPGETVASDSVVLTSYLSPLSGIALETVPDHLVAGESRTVRISLTIPYGQIDDDQVNLYVVNDKGENVTPVDVVKMKDGGDGGDGLSCDETAGDRVFSACKTFIQLIDTPIFVRARVHVPGTGVVATPIHRIDVVSRMAPNDCAAIRSTLQAARSAYQAAGAHEAGLDAATGVLTTPATDAVSVLKNAKVGIAAEGNGVWVRFQNGALGALPLGIPSNARGGFSTTSGALATHTIGSRVARLLRTESGSDEVDYAAGALKDSQCPPFDANGPTTGGNADLQAFRELQGLGVIAISAHGGAYFSDLAQHYQWRHAGFQEVLWTGDTKICDDLTATALPCQDDGECPGDASCVRIQGNGECIDQDLADIMLGRVVLGAEGTGITPAFVTHYAQDRLPNTLVYVGACYSHWNGSMAMAFLGAGAGAYLGYSGVVSDAFATAAGTHLFDGMVNDLKTLKKGACLAQDPTGGKEAAWLRMAGNSALSLDIADLLNAGLEGAGLEGWSSAGDARRVTSFCGTQPSEGKFMAVLSTGLGFAKEAGSLSQEFCIPSGAQTLQFSWRYISAELEHTCGLSGVQDKWTVSLSSNNSSQTLDILDCTVNDMCEYEAAFCLPKPCNPGSDCTCGDCYKPYQVEPSCLFVNQPVMATDFLQESINVSVFAGKGPVTLTFTVDDKAKQVLETAVLIDALRIQ